MSRETVASGSQPQNEARTPPGRLDTALLAAMALACGIFVSNVYYNQPLLELLHQAFPQAGGLVSVAPTATQLGFACGLFFLVPLGDRVDRRKLILGQAAALVVALIVLAATPNAWGLVLASACVGISASVAQQIVPFAAELAAPDRRGQAVGIVMSGVLCGLLLGRAVGGVVGDHWGWRATYWLGAVLTALAWLVLRVKLPHSEPQAGHGYFALMRSLIGLWRAEPLLRRATCIQAALFASFMGLWTILALWGSVAGLIAGILLLDIGEQLALISNQHVIYALQPQARSRLNTLFMSGMFVGGAAGSWVAGLSWRMGDGMPPARRAACWC